MAQHRTKKEKQVAQIRREQQLYSLSTLKTTQSQLTHPNVKLSTKSTQLSRSTQVSPSQETQYLAQDLRRTLLAAVVVFGSLIGVVVAL